jgi:hypothetical protein
MAVMTERMFLLLNGACFLFLLTFLLSFALSLLPLTLALTVMLVNLYHLLRTLAAPSPRSSRLLNAEGRS